MVIVLIGVTVESAYGARPKQVVVPVLSDAGVVTPIVVYAPGTCQPNEFNIINSMTNHVEVGRTAQKIA